MTKWLNRWLRKIHRWLAIPFIVAILILIFARQVPLGSAVQRVQQVMILLMVVTGSYLFLLPYLSKWRRQRRTPPVEGGQPEIGHAERGSA